MKQVTDEFLLTLATIAATLIGLLLVGGFFYLETGFRRATLMARTGEPFLRATIKLTLLLYAIVLGLSLGLVVLRAVWLALVFWTLGLALLAALVDWTARYRDLRGVVPIPRASPWLAWPAVVVVLALPWALDGWDPGREAMTWSLLLAGTLAVSSTAGLLLTSFDLARWEGEAGAGRADADDDPTGG